MGETGPPGWMMTLWFGSMGVVSVLWVAIQVINWRHGYEYDVCHRRDFAHFREIIKAEADPKRRRLYRYLLYGTYFWLVFFVGMFVAIGLRMWFRH